MRDALELVASTQTAFWGALSDLERVTEIDDIDSNRDFEGMSVEDLFVGEGADEDGDEENEDDCTCDDRSWYGPEHDSTCPLEGPRAGFDASIGGVKHG